MIRTVLYFTDSASFGGAEQVLLTILAELDRQRWRPILAHHSDPGIATLLEKARSLDVKLQAVPRMQCKRDIARVLQFTRGLRASPPDVFHAQLSWPLSCRYGLIAAALARVPVIVATEHLFFKPPWLRSVLLKQLVSTGVDRYIAVSHEVARQLRRNCPVLAHKIRVVQNGIRITPFKGLTSSALRATLTGATARPIVLTTARLDKQKGLNYLLQAAAQVPEAMFVIAGDGPERARTEAQINELGLVDRVILLGHRDDVPDLLASCDVFVLPSLFEGLPISVLEAMAAGRPVIATAIGGTDEAIIHGESGLLVPPADANALGAAIRTVLSDRALAQRLGAAGQARVEERFSAAVMVRGVVKIYEDLLPAA